MKTIKSEMVSFPFVIEPTMTIAEAQTFMAQQDLRHLPVVDSGNKLLGVVSERDVLSSKKPNIPITNIMVTQVFVVQENEGIHTVIETMANEKYGSVLIVNAANELTGIFTTIDALNLLSKLLKSEKSAKKPLILSLLDLTRA